MAIIMIILFQGGRWQRNGDGVTTEIVGGSLYDDEDDDDDDDTSEIVYDYQ